MTSEYEKKRLGRLQENQMLLRELGIELDSKKTIGKRKPTESLKRKGLVKEQKRTSRRLRGDQPEHVGYEDPEVPDQVNKENLAIKENNVNSIVDEDDSLLPLMTFHPFDDSEGDADLHRRLFMVPTGIPGVNDHTLDTPVQQCDNNYLWGFCDGLFTRIFAKIRPGDILLMTSSGSGSFNRITRVKEKRVVSKAEADQFWSRMKFSMGGSVKTNVGFPLLVLVDQPKLIDWNKVATMKMAGYRDHLQSSRWIRPDSLLSQTGQVLFQKCLTSLDLKPTLSAEEAAASKKLP